MGVLLMFFTYLIGLICGTVHFLRQAFQDGSIWPWIPFLGCAIGLFFSLRLARFILKNHKTMEKLFNVAQNVETLCRIQHQQDPLGLRRAVDELSVKPAEFKASLSAKGISVPVG